MESRQLGLGEDDNIAIMGDNGGDTGCITVGDTRGGVCTGATAGVIFLDTLVGDRITTGWKNGAGMASIIATTFPGGVGTVTSGASRRGAGRGDAALQATPSPWDGGMVLLEVDSSY